MKIALLTRNPKLFSHQRLMETAIARGHDIVPIDYLRCYMNITSRKPELRYLGEKLMGFDAVIPRIAASHTFYGLAVLRQFEMMGVYPLNESVAIGRSRDKLRSLQILSREGVGMPVTAFANTGQVDLVDVVVRLRVREHQHWRERGLVEPVGVGVGVGASESDDAGQQDALVARPATGGECRLCGGNR